MGLLYLSPELAFLRDLVQELDEIGWDIQEQVELGKRPSKDYAVAFARARAAGAVAEALNVDSFLAAANAVYEAYAATENLEAIRAMVRTSL